MQNLSFLIQGLLEIWPILFGGTTKHVKKPDLLKMLLAASDQEKLFIQSDDAAKYI